MYAWRAPPMRLRVDQGDYIHMNANTVFRWGWRILLVTIVVVSVATVNDPRTGQASDPRTRTAKRDASRHRQRAKEVPPDTTPDRAGLPRERLSASVRSLRGTQPVQASTTGTASQVGDALCSQTANCQARDNVDAKKSNRTNFNVADDFRPSASGSITEACWWGTYGDDAGGSLVDCHDTNVVDAFEITYRSDAGGFPGTTLAAFSQALGNLTVTGPTATGDLISGALREFAYSATHAPFAVTADECYWIEITNDSGACSWFWEVSREGGDWAMLDGDGVNPPDGFDLYEFLLLDFAFCVDVGLSAASPCGPPADDACPSSQPCCEGGPVDAFGCDDDLCCRRVCACDPDCCNPAVGWDEFCATTGFIEGCGAEILCAQECSPCGGPNTGDCCADTGSASCNDLTCCEAVCAEDPFCCEDTWDDICAGDAETICPELCGICGNPASGDCCTSTPLVPGCSDQTCCDAVCDPVTGDPSCCDPSIGWDRNCATIGWTTTRAGALYLCTDLCSPCNLCGDIAGDGISANGLGSNADLADYAAFVDCLDADLRARPECFCSDLNDDQVIDVADYAILVGLLESTSTNSPPSCGPP